MSKPYTSGLSASDFAATLQLGMTPLAMVQGCCVIGWHRHAKNSPYWRPRFLSREHQGAVLSSYKCPHVQPAMSGHWTWGENFEQPWKSDAWNSAFGLAVSRMLDQAASAGAHGVIGVMETNEDVAEGAVRELRVWGTAVVVDGEPSPTSPWACRLKGQALAKLLEAGRWPVSVVATMASVRSWAVCSTKMLMKGDFDDLAVNSRYRVKPGSPITQLADAEMQGRRLARDRLAEAIGDDMLFGGALDVEQREVAEGDLEIDCYLRGSRVERRKHGRPVEPIPVLNLK